MFTEDLMKYLGLLKNNFELKFPNEIRFSFNKSFKTFRNWKKNDSALNSYEMEAFEIELDLVLSRSEVYNAVAWIVKIQL